MSLLNITPTKRNDAIRRWESFSPFVDLQRDLDRMADDLNRTFKWTAMEPLSMLEADFSPKVDVKEEKDAVIILAELPGMSEKDVEATLTETSLTLKGEKKSEKEEKRKDYYRMERSYGSFERVIGLPCEVEINKADATFKHGVLTVHIPKSAQAKVEGKKIHIKAA